MVNECQSSPYDSVHIKPDSRCIRLLRVHPPVSNQAEEDPIQCDLFVADLAAEPAFTALSYVWGAFAPEPHKVHYEKFAIPVSSNGYSALLHLRRKLGEFTVWMDAVCINQQDDRDKEQQIPLMGDIYAGASTVYVWLGEDSPSTKHAIGWLSTTGFVDYCFRDGNVDGQLFAKPRVWAAVCSYHRRRWSLKKSYAALRTTTRAVFTGQILYWVIPFSRKLRLKRRVGFATTDQIEDFLRCEWVERIWTFQEIMLANNPVIVRGDHHISWSRFIVSVIFHSTVYGPTYSENLVLHHWVDLILDRVYVQDALSDPTNTCTDDTEHQRLVHYCDFIWTVVGNLKMLRVWYMSTVVAIPIVCATGLFLDIALWKNGTALVVLVWGILIPASVFILFAAIKVLVPNPPLKLRSNPSAERRLNTKPVVPNSILETLRIRKATNPKDMSFGLHSVLRQTSEKLLPTVDYKTATGTIYTRLALYLMEESESLHLLSLAAQAHLSDAPSWVPDFSQNLDPVNDRGNLPATQPEWRLDEDDPESLIVQGAIVDTILSKWIIMSTASTYHESEWAEHTANIRTIQQLIKGCWSALGYITVANVFLLSSSFDYRDLGAYLFFLWRTRHKNPSTVLSLLLSSAWFFTPSHFLGWTRYSQVLKVHIEFCNFVCSRYALVQLEKKLAILPHPVEMGDGIAIISGVPELLVVRRSGDSVRLVSRTTTGVMDSTQDANKVTQGGTTELLGLSYIKAKTKGAQFEDMTII
ncbi:heterokaryon incompatibility protein-domain-containing protein [Lophiotrema nucula]|uniref:Heterokaryon incompatibility protein-domain-containing protein n=1 Tax=Lophiotrema nucula TaxID=690887 RepID=A0A6A5YM44_9PLEO|nr:heterokaryon incompatibility protein-domain-containing protein [Lophiotrema nucula]